MLTNSTITLIESIMLILILSQAAYAILVFILGFIMVDYYEWGIFREPTTWLQKTTNMILMSIFGIGPFLYKRFRKHNLIVSKFYYLISLLGVGIICFLLYHLISGILFAIHVTF